MKEWFLFIGSMKSKFTWSNFEIAILIWLDFNFAQIAVDRTFHAMKLVRAPCTTNVRRQEVTPTFKGVGGVKRSQLPYTRGIYGRWRRRGLHTSCTHVQHGHDVSSARQTQGRRLHDAGLHRHDAQSWSICYVRKKDDARPLGPYHANYHGCWRCTTGLHSCSRQEV